ncbi:MAG: metal-sulfur cluster assembly factor [Actinomycetota bacterium]|nr:metal-sulfur cluster assembly factor [Actinomycetota bacterium]
MSRSEGARVSRSDKVSIGPTREQTAPSSAVEGAWGALGCVYDPELCLDVVSLGLVYRVWEDETGLHVEMTLTTPGCPAAEAMPEIVRHAVQDAVGPQVAVDVALVWDPPWSPAMMAEDAAAALGLRR